MNLATTDIDCQGDVWSLKTGEWIANVLEIEELL